MKLINLTCPNCGAELQVNEELSQAVCNHCGKAILLKKEIDSRKMGFDFERGRMDAQSTVNQELAQKIKSLIQPLSKAMKLNMEADINEAKIEILRDSCENNKQLAIKIFIISTVIGVIFPFPFLLFSDIHNALLFLSIPICIVAGVLLNLPFLYKLLQLSAATKKQERLLRKIEESTSDINQEDLELIPQEYWNKEALSYIHRSLMSMRAMSMQQAITQYEQHKNMMREETLKKEQMRIEQENYKEQLRIQKESLQEQKYQSKLHQKEIEQRRENAKNIGKNILKGATTLGAAVVFHGLFNRHKR